VRRYLCKPLFAVTSSCNRGNEIGSFAADWTSSRNEGFARADGRGDVAAQAPNGEHFMVGAPRCVGSLIFQPPDTCELEESHGL
jgi:hypothetical protein